MIYIGNKEISKLYLGGKAVASAWIGAKKVYPSGSPIPTNNVIEGTLTSPRNTISVTFNYVDANNSGTTVEMTKDNLNFYLTEYTGETLTSLKRAFNNRYMMASLTKFDLDTSNVTTMNNMFHGCNGNESIIDVSLMDTSNVTDMSYMFDYCSHVKELKYNLNTSKVTDMTSMFQNCSEVKTLDVSNFDTSKVTNMGSMFSGCSGLTSLDVSNFDTSKVTNMGFMFDGCSSLTSLDLTSFNLISLSYAFDENTFDCPSVTDFRLSSKFFNASDNVTKYDFRKLTNWTNADSLAVFVDVLPQLTSTKTVKLSTNTKNALTDNQKATISNKGWTIA